jgi:hypothetical protein
MENWATKPFGFKMLVIGALAAAGGLYFVFVGFGLLPEPSRINGPLWLSTFVGLVFFLGGVSVGLRGYLKMDDSETELPPGAPQWAKLIWWGNAILICGSLASVGTWIAFGPGSRHFGVAGVINGPIGEGIGRAAFGLGALIAWFITIAFAYASARRIFRP